MIPVKTLTNKNTEVWGVSSLESQYQPYFVLCEISTLFLSSIWATCFTSVGFSLFTSKIRNCLDQEFSNLGVHHNHLEDVEKHRWMDCTSKVSESVGLGWGQEFIFLTSSQVLLMLLVQGPYFVEQWSRRWSLGLICISIQWPTINMPVWLSSILLFLWTKWSYWLSFGRILLVIVTTNTGLWPSK